MTATQLSLYNGALRLCGEAKLANLTEDREPRYVLDDVWDDGALRHCLQQGLWNFAMRTVEAEYSPSVEPSFGFRRAFDRSEEHTSELQSLMRISYAVFCLKKKKHIYITLRHTYVQAKN